MVLLKNIIYSLSAVKDRMCCSSPSDKEREQDVSRFTVDKMGSIFSAVFNGTGMRAAGVKGLIFCS